MSQKPHICLFTLLHILKPTPICIPKEILYMVCVSLWIIIIYVSMQRLFRGPNHCHPTCRVLKFWLPTVRCWKIEESCYTLNLVHFHQTDRFDLAWDRLSVCPRLDLTSNSKIIWRELRHGSSKSRVLICNIDIAPVSMSEFGCMVYEVQCCTFTGE